MLKIDLDRFPSDKVIEFLSNAEKLKVLSDSNIFKNNLDFNQNFSGLISKEEAITWLINNRDFRMQGSYDLATHTILDKDLKISGNCSTFLQLTKKIDIRYNF